MASEAGSSSSNSFSGVQDLINCGAPIQFSYDYSGGHMMQVPSGLANFSSVDQKSVGDRFFQPALMSRSALEMRKMTAQEIVEAKALAASKSQSEAERRRRERINNHLATLRSLLPNTTKTDKASLLAEVIDHVREVKRMVDDTGQASPVHSEADEESLEYPDPNEEGRSVIRASLCCEDRPELLSNLIKTLRSLRLLAVKAEIATLGGRVKNVLVVTSGDSQDPNDVTETPSASSIKEALKAVMEKQNSGDLSPASSSGGNKRQLQVDMIALSGAHTVGFSHCSQFASRIYNFSTRRAVDPSLNSSYAAQLQQMCPRIVDPTIAINMDPTTPRQFDNVYYKNLQSGEGLFSSDQFLFTDLHSQSTVNTFAQSSTAFNMAFVIRDRVPVDVSGNGKISNPSFQPMTVLQELKRLLEIYKDEEISIITTGHSLDATLTTLCAFDIVLNGINKPNGRATSIPVTAILFASPRVGNDAFKKVFDKLPDLSLLRVTNNHDLIPMYPLGYTHVGVELRVDTEKSPYLKNPGHASLWHNLKSYLHAVADTRGKNNAFTREVDRDISLVNKSIDWLKDEYLVPDSWWDVKNKGMVQVNDRHWTLAKLGADDFPLPDHD